MSRENCRRTCKSVKSFPLSLKPHPRSPQKCSTVQHIQHERLNLELPLTCGSQRLCEPYVDTKPYLEDSPVYRNGCTWSKEQYTCSRDSTRGSYLHTPSGNCWSIDKLQKFEPVGAVSKKQSVRSDFDENEEQSARTESEKHVADHVSSNLYGKRSVSSASPRTADIQMHNQPKYVDPVASKYLNESVDVVNTNQSVPRAPQQETDSNLHNEKQPVRGRSRKSVGAIVSNCLKEFPDRGSMKELVSQVTCVTQVQNEQRPVQDILQRSVGAPLSRNLNKLDGANGRQPASLESQITAQVACSLRGPVRRKKVSVRSLTRNDSHEIRASHKMVDIDKERSSRENASRKNYARSAHHPPSNSVDVDRETAPVEIASQRSDNSGIPHPYRSVGINKNTSLVVSQSGDDRELLRPLRKSAGIDKISPIQIKLQRNYVSQVTRPWCNSTGIENKISPTEIALQRNYESRRVLQSWRNSVGIDKKISPIQIALQRNVHNQIPQPSSQSVGIDKKMPIMHFASQPIDDTEVSRALHKSVGVNKTNWSPRTEIQKSVDRRKIAPARKSVITDRRKLPQENVDIQVPEQLHTAIDVDKRDPSVASTHIQKLSVAMPQRLLPKKKQLSSGEDICPYLHGQETRYELFPDQSSKLINLNSRETSCPRSSNKSFKVSYVPQKLSQNGTTLSPYDTADILYKGDCCYSHHDEQGSTCHRCSGAALNDANLTTRAKETSCRKSVNDKFKREAKYCHCRYRKSLATKCCTHELNQNPRLSGARQFESQNDDTSTVSDFLEQCHDLQQDDFIDELKCYNKKSISEYFNRIQTVNELDCVCNNLAPTGELNPLRSITSPRLNSLLMNNPYILDDKFNSEETLYKPFGIHNKLVMAVVDTVLSNSLAVPNDEIRPIQLDSKSSKETERGRGNCIGELQHNNHLQCFQTQLLHKIDDLQKIITDITDSTCNCNISKENININLVSPQENEVAQNVPEPKSSKLVHLEGNNTIGTRIVCITLQFPIGRERLIKRFRFKHISRTKPKSHRQFGRHVADESGKKIKKHRAVCFHGKEQLQFEASEINSDFEIIEFFKKESKILYDLFHRHHLASTIVDWKQNNLHCNQDHPDYLCQGDSTSNFLSERDDDNINFVHKNLPSFMSSISDTYRIQKILNSTITD